MTRSPLRAAPRRARGWCRGSRWRPRRCRRRPTCAAAWPTWTVAPSSRSCRPARESCGVAAGHRHAALEHDPRDARHAGTADADEVHPAEVSGGDRVDRLDAGSSASASRPQTTSSDHAASRCRRPCGPCWRPRSDIAATRSGSRQHRQHARATIHSGVSSASSTSRPPPACDDRLGVEPLLAVADAAAGRRRRAARRRSARRRSSRPLRHSTKSAAA